MADILKKAQAGTLESSDAFIEVEPSDKIELELESVVQKQFGASIKNMVKEVLQEEGISGARVRIIDRGALDCVIRARLETALERGREA